MCNTYKTLDRAFSIYNSESMPPSLSKKENDNNFSF